MILKNVQQMLSSINALHTANGDSGSGRYEEKCEGCVAKQSQGSSGKCLFMKAQMLRSLA